MLESFKIIALATLAAILYGILHDLVTTRICLEYFTIFHPPLFNGTTNPTLLALGWGVIATWWVGLPLGIILAICSRSGKLPKRSARQLLKPLTITLLILAALAALSGIIGYHLTASGRYIPPNEITSAFLRPEHIPFFIADAFTHLASYAFGALLGLALSLYTLIKRYRFATRPSQHLN